MAENPTIEGPVKSLRQATPGGDIVAGVFALIAALILVNAVLNPPIGAGILVSLFFILVFAVPAYVVWGSARSTGVFVTEDRVEYRLLGRPRVGWKRSEVGSIEAQAGGLKVLDPNGRELRRFRFRWWRTEQVVRFARSAGLGGSGDIPTARATGGA